MDSKASSSSSSLMLVLFCMMLVSPTPSSAFDYCTITSNHTMCKPPKGSACGSSFTRMSPDEGAIDAIVEWHNSIRQRAAQGFETKSRGTLPQAANMMKVHWDTELATIAQRHADQCVVQHDCSTCRNVEGNRFGVGQNIAYAWYSGSPQPTTVDYKGLMEGWYKGEVEIFKKSYVHKYVFGKWGHYSQMIWWNTRSVGCGASIYHKSGRSHHLVVCNYGRSGNIRGTKVYDTGKKCSKCPEGTECDSQFNALCTPSSPDFDVLEPFSTDNSYLLP